VPVDAEIASEAMTRVAAVDVDLLLEQMAVPSGRWGGRRPRLGGSVTVMGAADGATAAGGC
jgi:hypothetical protein